MSLSFWSEAEVGEKKKSTSNHKINKGLLCNVQSCSAVPIVRQKLQQEFSASAVTHSGADNYSFLRYEQ